jgi:hypothetical protein
MRRRPRRALAACGLLAALALWPTAAPAQERVEGNTYENTRYGIRISKPSDWYFITAGTILDLARQTAGAPPGRPEADPVKAAGFAVVVSKVPVLGRAFDPQAIVLVHELAKPATDLVQTCEGLRTGMTDPTTVKPTQPIRLDGKPAARLDFQGYVDGTLVRATALCAVRERQVFVVVGQAQASDFDTEALTFDVILSSFHLQ